MTEKSMLVCVDPTQECWQLGSLPPVTGRVTLVGWQLPGAAIDCGVPFDIAVALARALTSVACVTFPATGAGLAAIRESTVQGTQVRSAGPQGLKERADAVLKRQPSTVDVVSTRDPAVALTLFDDPGYPWCLQGQVAFLSAPDSPPPPVDRETLFSVFADGWEENVDRLRGAGIFGLLRPGVDGDVAGMFTLAGDAALVDALRREAAEAGFGWFLLSENEFKQSLGGALG
jgi:hypothetical protein